ncbi:MAG TPA: TetR/AcrR family transcriptional regulator [Prolixibacteraceae bacterium]|nr:TetR/AcrR family transcriptional regulator [Prolixibacteraceae bacterium]
MEDKKLFILQNVGRLYMKFGIRGVTMDDVAREFGISKKTLYQYFNDKEDLVNQVIDYYLENPVFNLNKKDLGNSIDRIFALRTHVAQILKHFNNNLEFDLKKQYPGLYKKVHSFKRKRIYTDTVRNIESGINDGLYRPGLDPDFIAKLQVGRMLFTLNPDNEIFKDQEIASLALFDKVIDYHMSAICTEKGLKYYRKQLNIHQNED